MKITFIGYGNMARALIQGFEKNPTLHIHTASPSLTTGQQGAVFTHSDNKAAIAQADFVFLTVKPAKMAEVLHEIGQALPPQAVLLSVAAGVSLEFIQSFCRPQQAIIRCMPNLAHAVGQGATPLVANEALTPTQRQQVATLFEQAGMYAWVREDQLNAFTAVSGSGPAYVFLFIEALVNGAIQLGLDAEMARDFVRQTLRGAVTLWETSGLSAQALREKVTSPAGTTAAAIAVLQAQGFESLVESAMKAAFERAKELGSIDTASKKQKN